MRFLKKFSQLFRWQHSNNKDKNSESQVTQAYLDAWSDPESVSFEMDVIESLARENKDEFESLISIFNKEEDLQKKIILSDVLVSLNYFPVKDFFMDILLHKEKSIWPKLTYSKREHLDYELWAAFNLVQMKDKQGCDFLKNIVKTLNDSNLRWIVAELFDPDELKNITEFDLKLLLELMDICEGLGKYANREKVEKKLVQLREQKRA